MMFCILAQQFLHNTISGTSFIRWALVVFARLIDTSILSGRFGCINSKSFRSGSQDNKDGLINPDNASLCILVTVIEIDYLRLALAYSGP